MEIKTLNDLVHAICNTPSTLVENDFGALVSPSLFVTDGEQEFSIKNVWVRGDNKMVIEVVENE